MNTDIWYYWAYNLHWKSQKFNSQFWVLVISKFPLKEWLHSSAASRLGFTAALRALLWSLTSRQGSLPFKVSLPPREPQPCVLITTCACGSRITRSYVTHCHDASSVCAKRFVIQQRAKSSLWFLYYVVVFALSLLPMQGLLRLHCHPLSCEC